MRLRISHSSHGGLFPVRSCTYVRFSGLTSFFLPLTANFSLPEKCDYMDEVTYGELEKEEAQPIVTKYKEEARKLLPPSEKRTNRRNNRNKRNRQNRSRGQGYGESRGRADPQPQCAVGASGWCRCSALQGPQPVRGNKEVPSLRSSFFLCPSPPTFLTLFSEAFLQRKVVLLQQRCLFP